MAKKSIQIFALRVLMRVIYEGYTDGSEENFPSFFRVEKILSQLTLKCLW
jgi:hypothetical protein